MFAQKYEPCGTDAIHLLQMQEDPEYREQFLEQQQNIRNYLKKDNSHQKRSLMPEVIPVVFHVIHLGEPVGIGSNVPDSEILAALDQLNQDFANTSGDGEDMVIQFCLAQRDPNGDATSGINRVDGTGTGNYETFGIVDGFNEVNVKALSIWPNTEYINVWIVHDIPGGVIGYSRFPGAPASLDGVVLDDLVLDDPDWDHVITHEFGHFFALHHTFEGGNELTGTCPPNINCFVEGDMCCDTRPHYNTWPDNYCLESEFEDCDDDPYNFDVHKNYMNYIEMLCMTTFTPDQVERANAALHTQRFTLLNSLGCEPPCDNLSVDFTPSTNSVFSPVTINFTNNSTGGVNSDWTVDGVNFSNNANSNFDFTDAGDYLVCLTETDATGCSEIQCQTLQIFGTDPCIAPLEDCNLVLNGNLEQSTIPVGTFCDGSQCDNSICNWDIVFATPIYCSNDLQDDVLTLGDWRESVVTQNNLNLVDGQTYTLSFEYLNRAPVNSPTNYTTSIEVGLTDGLNPIWGIHPLELPLLTLNNPALDLQPSGYQFCNYDGISFNLAEVNFTYNAGEPTLLYIRNNRTNFPPTDPARSWLTIKNISISDCGCSPILDIEMSDDCPTSFTATNTGEGDTYVWEFCDGQTMTGQTVSPSLPPGPCQVCVTAFCGSDEEDGTTICQDFIIPECDKYICEIIDDYGANNKIENSGRDILAWTKQYTFVGNMGIQAQGTDHYIVTRDFDDDMDVHNRIGDYGEIESDIERSTAIARRGAYRYVTGYTKSEGRGKDIYVAKLGPTNNIIWCKIYDYGGWDQEGLGLKVVGPSFTSPITKIYVTGYTHIGNGFTDMFLLKLNDNTPSGSPGGVVADFNTYGWKYKHERANDILKVNQSLILVGEQNNRATALKLDFYGNIQGQFRLAQSKTSYNSVCIRDGVCIAVGSIDDRILVTGFNFNDMSLTLNDRIYTPANRIEEARDVIYRDEKFYMVGRSGVYAENQIQDDGFIISFVTGDNSIDIIDQQLTDLPFAYSESFHAIDKIESDMVIIGDIHLDNEYNDIFFVRTNDMGENCCTKPHEFKTDYLSRQVREGIGRNEESINSSDYGNRKLSYNEIEICQGEQMFQSEELTELRIDDNNTSLKVIPNPNQGTFVLEFDSHNTQQQIKTISIFDISGKEKFKTDSYNLGDIIDLAHFDSGIYIVQCVLVDGSLITKKAVITR